MTESEKESVWAAGCLLASVHLRDAEAVDRMDEKTFIKSIRRAFRNKDDIRNVAFALYQGVAYARYDKEFFEQLKSSMSNEAIPKRVIDNLVGQILTAKKKEEPRTSVRCVANVYLMKNSRNGFHKIGYSKNPQARESTLQSEEPEITLVAFWPGTLDDERRIHELYANYRIRGEWFALSESHIEEISEIMAACAELHNEKAAL